MPNPSIAELVPAVLQGVPAPGYSAVDLRRLAGASLQEGVIGIGGLKVSQRAAGAGLAVDIAAGDALVLGDSIAKQGLYYTLLGAAMTGPTELTALAGDGANPRIDQVVWEVKDSQHDGSGLNRVQARYIPGTPAAGATLSNRLGAATLPATAMRVADVLMPAGSAQVLAANIRDRRPWARGAYYKRNVTEGDYVGSGSAYSVIDGARLAPRIECSGVPVRTTVRSRVSNSLSSGIIGISVWVDGLVPTELGTDGKQAQFQSPFAGGEDGRPWQLEFTPAAGSRVIAPAWRVVGGTGTLNADPQDALQLVVEEDLRPSASND